MKFKEKQKESEWGRRKDVLILLLLNMLQTCSTAELPHHLTQQLGTELILWTKNIHKRLPSHFSLPYNNIKYKNIQARIQQKRVLTLPVTHCQTHFWTLPQASLTLSCVFLQPLGACRIKQSTLLLWHGLTFEYGCVDVDVPLGGSGSKTKP